MAAKKKAASRKTKNKPAPKLAPNAVKRGLAATEVALGLDHPDIASVVELVRKAGVIGLVVITASGLSHTGVPFSAEAVCA